MVETITLVSLVFAIAMALCLGVLILRRWQFERASAARKALERTVTRAYLMRLNDATTGPDVSGIDLSIRLSAVSHLLQLLRGGDRAHLLEFADADGLFAGPLKRTASLSPARRSDAIRVLEQFGSEPCVQSLIVLMANDRSREVRAEAAGALARLGRLPGVRDTISLLELKDHAPNRMHRAMFRSIAAGHIEEMRGLLATAIADPLRALLIDALGWSGDLSAVDDLARGATHPNPEIRCAALRAARQLGHPHARDWIIPLLSDEDENVRGQAARTCSKLRLQRAVPMLEAMREDTSWWVRMRADHALSLLVPPERKSLPQ